VKAAVKPTEKPGELLEYLEPRVEEVERKENDEIEVEIEKPEKLSRIPGIESYRVDGEKKEGLGGKPIHREAFFSIEDREDAARAFLATVDGCTLYVSTEREWDLRVLRKYNSEIVQAEKEVADELNVDELDEDFDLSREQLLGIYQEFLTE
jgi:hypothetical protein